MTLSHVQFADVVKRSQLVEADEVDAAVAELSAAREPTAAAIAEKLVQQKKLTKFQAKLLLSGKHKGFILKGKYKILEQVGSGGMGNVFLCEHLLLNRKVAVKTLHTAQLSDPSAVDRFMREARAVAALDDPNIIRVYDVEREGASPLMVMEYVEGESLYDLVKRVGPLPIATAAEYVMQTARGLQHASDVGIVHRDIKPSNLLLDKQGVIKILDMGLARFLQPDAKDDLTKKFDADCVLGTADFLAPEQAVDSSNVDTRADIYALGGTFFYLLTGKPPFELPTVAEKLLAHQMKPAPAVTTLRDDVPDEIERIIRQMMAKKADDRFQHPVEIVEILKPWLKEGVPIRREADESSKNTFTSMKAKTEPKLSRRPRSGNRPPARKSARGKNLLPWYIGGGIGILIIAVAGIVIATSGTSKPTTTVASNPAPPPQEPTVKQESPPPPVKKVVAPGKVTPSVKEAPPINKEAPPTKDEMRMVGAGDAIKHVGEAVAIRFEVIGTGYPKTRNVMFLNSASNYKEPTNLTVVISRTVGEKLFPQVSFDALDAKFKNKTVAVTGTITEFGGRAQIEVRDAEQIKIVE